MKSKKYVIIMTTFLGFILTACSSAGNRAETILEDSSMSNNGLVSETVVDKNLKLAPPYHFVIESENMDDFWNTFLPEIDISSEWIYADDAGYSIVISGALKDDSEQGTVNLISVNPDYTITDSRQILAPFKGGKLSITSDEASKDFVVEIEDEQGFIYLFNYYNGFTAYKDEKDGDWKYWEQ